MSERVTCVVPFCRRTTRGVPPTEWICGEHWKPLPLMRRLAFRRACKTRDPAQYWPLWDRLKAYAIELAAGISR